MYNWMAQDADGEIYKYIVKPETTLNGTWWNSGYRLVLEADNIVRSNWKDSLINLSKNDYIIKDGILMATRKHAALIHAWADGEVIQFKAADGVWYDCEMPVWDDTEFRIKPKTKTVKFRNYLHKGTVGLAIFGVTPIPKEYEWIDDDWREVEIEL